jgi:hypothetical protein
MEETTHNEISDKIKKDHPMSYKGILYSYSWDDIKESKPFTISLAFSIFLFILSLYSKKELFDIISFWSNQILTIFPNLLGFNLGGYALIVGFGNTELIQSLTQKKPEKKTSVFQKLSGIFGFTLLLQSITFSLAFIFNFIIQLGFDTSIKVIYVLINSIAIIVISFSGLWGLFILPSLIVNVFTFGQMHHLYLTKKRLIEKMDKEKEID